MTKSPLASEFPSGVKEDWLKLAAGGSAPTEPGFLASRLYEGFDVSPLYDKGDFESLLKKAGGQAFPPGLRVSARRPWRVIQLIDHLDIAEANRQLKDDLANGAGGFWLQLGGNIPYGGAYTGARTADELARVFDGANFETFEIYISGGFDALPGAALLCAVAKAAGARPQSIAGSAGLDPFSIIAASGYLPARRGSICADAVDAAHALKSGGFSLTPFLASGRAWHQAGASAVEELAYTLSATLAYWRELTASGFKAQDAIRSVDAMLTAECDLFLTIAKFRAAKLLWAKAAEGCGAPGARGRFLAEMSFRAITERDAHVNILRGTAAAFGAGLGGADGALIIPFNTRAGTPDAASRRLARNAQLILMEEAHLGRVADEAGGSWHIEALTHELAERAWGAFRAVEAAGGLLAALESGSVMEAILKARMRRERDAATAKAAITGVSSFPNLSEKPVAAYRGDAGFDLESLNRESDPPPLPEAGNGERFEALTRAAGEGATLRGLERALETVYERRIFLPSSSERLAEPFEKLRRASDLALQRVGARPPIFIAALGKPSDFTGRLTWIKSVFEAGGIEAFCAQGFADVEELQRAFRESPAPVACLCSGDRIYETMPGAAPALKNGGAAAVYVAAGPEALKAFSAEDRRAIDRIVYHGCDIVSLLEELHHILRVNEMGSAEYEDYDHDEDN